MKNADEGVILNACTAIEVLMTPSSTSKKHSGKSGDIILENLIDLMVRHGGLASLSSQIRQEGNSDIKKAALKVLSRLLSHGSQNLKELVVDEIKRLKLVSFCASQVERFPDEVVDEEVLICLLEVLALASAKSKTLTKYLTDEGTINKIAVQLTIVF